MLEKLFGWEFIQHDRDNAGTPDRCAPIFESGQRP